MDSQLFSADEIEDLTEDFALAKKIAAEDFSDNNWVAIAVGPVFAEIRAMRHDKERIGQID